jgi:hypothetical protein
MSHHNSVIARSEATRQSSAGGAVVLANSTVSPNSSFPRRRESIT